VTGLGVWGCILVTSMSVKGIMLHILRILAKKLVGVDLGRNFKACDAGRIFLYGFTAFSN